MKQKFVDAHMNVAEQYASLSSAKNLKVGCVIVKDNRIISIGYNGTPAGWDNECEVQFVDDFGNEVRKTKPEVLHAELNAIAKLARSSESGEGASMFITHSPCIECAKMIYATGIKEVFYRHSYREGAGIDFLDFCNIPVEHVSPYGRS
jgi:dCMP deaminase